MTLRSPANSQAARWLPVVSLRTPARARCPLPSGFCNGLERHDHGFHFRVEIEHFAALFAAPTRLFEPAERQRRIDPAVRVDADGARANAADHLVCRTQVARPHAA